MWSQSAPRPRGMSWSSPMSADAPSYLPAQEGGRGWSGGRGDMGRRGVPWGMEGRRGTSDSVGVHFHEAKPLGHLCSELLRLVLPVLLTLYTCLSGVSTCQVGEGAVGGTWCWSTRACLLGPSPPSSSPRHSRPPSHLSTCHSCGTQAAASRVWERRSRWPGTAARPPLCDGCGSSDGVSSLPAPTSGNPKAPPPLPHKRLQDGRHQGRRKLAIPRRIPRPSHASTDCLRARAGSWRGIASCSSASRGPRCGGIGPRLRRL